MQRDRFGFRWVEWAVIIGVVVILLGLLLPAVNTTRGPHRATQCATQLKNIGLAAIQAENTHGQLPGWAMHFGTYDPAITPGNPMDPEADPASLRRHRKIGTWAVALLPYLDAQATYEQWTQDRYPIIGAGSDDDSVSSGASGRGYLPGAAPNLAVMRCPSSPGIAGDMGQNSYIANTGLYFPPDAELTAEQTVTTPAGEIIHVDFAESMLPAYGVFANQFAGLGKDANPVPVGPAITLDDCIDGQGNTALFSENLQAMPWHRVGFSDAEDLVLQDPGRSEIRYPVYSRFTNGWVWHDAGSELGDGGSAVDRINSAPADVELTALSMNPSNAGDLARPSSAHAEGVYVAFADGTVRFILETVDPKVLRAMQTPAGREGVVDQ